LDKGYLARTSVPLWASGILDRQVLEMQNILQAYEHNPPIDGDVFKLGEKPNWDFTVCMFLLCYFDAEQQTNAVLSMCEATKEAVYLYSGQGAVLTPRLVYDQAQVRARFPGVNIVILDDRTHHIMLPAGQIRPAPESSSSKA
jgi:hypothetical protein